MELKLELVYIFNKTNISAAFRHLTHLEISFQIKVPLSLLVSFEGERQGSLIRYIQQNICPLTEDKERKQ